MIFQQCRLQKNKMRRHPEPYRVFGGKAKDPSYFFAFAFAYVAATVLP